MSRSFALMGLLSLLSVLGCDSESGDEALPDVPQRPMDASLDDADESTTDTGEAETLDTGGEGQDAEIDSEPEPPPLRDVEDCEDVCEIYAECDALESEWPSEGEAGCMDACEGAALSQAWRSYLSCLQLTWECPRLEECIMPSRPLPECDAVCEALIACDSEFSLPLPEREECAAACEDNTLSYPLRVCGSSAVDEGSCDTLMVQNCLLENQAPACHQSCIYQQSCDPELDSIACTLGCLNALEGMDPIQVQHARDLRDCHNAAEEECEAHTACLGIEPCVEVDPSPLCEADACGFFDEEQCEEAALALICRSSEESMSCLQEGISGECEGLWSCLEDPIIPGEFCTEICQLQALCDLLPQDLPAIDCDTQCRAALVIGAERGRLQAEVPCLSAESCDDLDLCMIQASPERRCDFACARREECELSLEGCLEACDGSFSSRRTQGELSCLEAGGSCESLLNCLPPARPDCALLCAELEPCGVEPANCIQSCDDAHLDMPSSYLENLSCTLSAGRCPQRRQCMEGEYQAGEPCQIYCVYREKCLEEPDIESCLLSCAPGGGLLEESMAFDVGVECLLEAGREGSCEEYEACLAPVEDPCPAHCALLEGCGLVEEECEARCAEEFAQDPEPFACASRAKRRDAGCAVVAECMGIEVPVAGPACLSLCQAQAECQPGLDPFICERGCEESGETYARAFCAEGLLCQDIQLLCLDPEVVPEPPECAEACALTAACDPVVEGYSEEAFCMGKCRAAVMRGDELTAGNLHNCVQTVNCDLNILPNCFVGAGGSCTVEQTIQDCVDSRLQEHIDACSGVYDQARIDCIASGLDLQGDQFSCMAAYLCF